MSKSHLAVMGIQFHSTKILEKNIFPGAWIQPEAGLTLDEYYSYTRGRGHRHISSCYLSKETCWDCSSGWGTSSLRWQTGLHLFISDGKWECSGLSVWGELIWDFPGPNKQIKWKQITSVWLDVWRDQCISGREEMENKQSLVKMKRIQ